MASRVEERGRKQSAVLVLVFRNGDGELRLVLVVRGVRGVHGGQLGLPGGRSEPQDASPLATALREAEEEIGLAPSDLEVLASFAPIDSWTTGFRGALLPRTGAPAGMAARRGRDQRGPDTARTRARRPGAAQPPHALVPTWSEARRIECVPVDGGHLVWGLTLRLLDRVVPRLLAGDWDV